MTNYRSTVSLEVHRGPITKGCGMTETPIDQAVCQHCGHSSTMLPSDHERLYGHRYDTVPSAHGQLPERADMPRIMDERTNATVVWSPERGWHDDGERVQVRNVGGRLDTYNYGTMHADVRHTRTDDTRTRAQLDDGCVTGCNCNGTSPKG